MSSVALRLTVAKCRRGSHLAESGPKTTSVLTLYAASFKFVVVQLLYAFTSSLRG